MRSFGRAVGRVMSRLKGLVRGAQPSSVLVAWLCGALPIGLGLSLSAIAQTVTYIHTDGLGSIVAESDVNGDVVKRYAYEPYGAAVGDEAHDGPGFTGHVSDWATGLSFMQQRYMDPQLGMFLSADPVPAYRQPLGQFNRYRYANGNPYRFTDPDGRQVSDPRSCHDAGTCIPLAQAQEQVGRDGRLLLKMLGSAAGAGATGGLTAEGGAVLSTIAGAMRTAHVAGRDFEQASTYIGSNARELGLTGGRSGRRTTEFEGRGGSAGADELFDSLTRGVSEARDGGRLGKLGDGSIVQMSARTTSEGVRETSVRLSTQKTGTRIREVIKVRFREAQE